MIFSEQKTEKGFCYKVVDAFGTMELESSDKLSAETLDQAFMAVFNLKDKGKEITGTIKDTNISYKYLRKNPWQQTKKESKQSIG